MIRRIIKINEGLCNGCGACAAACHEGAIGMVDGKAVLLKDDYCDGLGTAFQPVPLAPLPLKKEKQRPMTKLLSRPAWPGQQKRGQQALSLRMSGFPVQVHHQAPA